MRKALKLELKRIAGDVVKAEVGLEKVSAQFDHRRVNIRCALNLLDEAHSAILVAAGET